MDRNELKKELIRNKTMAELSHYCSGNLYYSVTVADGTYQFPISTVEYKGKGDVDEHGNPKDSLMLSSDLGTTVFSAQEKASMLWRWINKALDQEEFVKL